MRNCLLLLFTFICSFISAQSPYSPDRHPEEARIISLFLSDNIQNELEFHIIETEEMKIFDIASMKDKYLVPEIFEDKKEENELIFESIIEFSENYKISYYIPCIFGIRKKASGDAWQPYWYFLFLDDDYNVIGDTHYVP